ncbi:O-antigen ligase family protein [Neobacillus bataviensis]|uniref:O-antigen ligase family protein n=1 Tax=Neobacillus bataviensis TaxID=220685 RepID=UPI001CBDB804|nr:O-antigen ligase family protein [Neobacillus bataviensis]
MFWFIVLFPLMIYPWGIDPYYTTSKTNYLYLFVVAAWLFIIFKRKHRTLLPAKDESKAIYILLAFLSLVELSTAFSNYTYSSVYGSIDRKEGLVTFFSYCSVFLFSYKLVDLKKVNIVFPGIAIVSMIVSLYGILQHYSLDFLPRNSAMRGYTGTYTFFDNPNFFGSYLVLILLISMMMYLTEKNKKLLSLYFIASSLGFIALIFSSTRSGYVGVFCGAVFLSLLVVLKRKYLWKRWTSLLITLGLLLFGINITENGQYFNRINSVVTDTYSVASNKSTGHEGSSRFFIWEKSLPLVPKYFWVGSGPDTFEFVFKASPEELQEFFGTPNITVDKAHNEYLQIAITLGTPALLTYLLFIFVIFRRAFKAVRQAEGNEKLILSGLIATIIGYLVQAFFNISTVPVAPIFWAILGITMAKSEYILKNANAVHSFEEVTEKSA